MMTGPIRKEVVIGDCRLILGNCLDVLPLLGKVDAVVSDPPYGIGYQRGKGGAGWKTAGGKRAARRDSDSNDLSIHGDDVPFDPTPFLGADDVILWGANHFAARLPHGRWLAWDKLAGLAAFDNFSDVEFAWRNGRGKDRVFSHLWKGLLQDQKGGSREARQHPTQKPVALMKWCIGFVADDRVIVDPYMGSGSTGVACVNLGRKFIGIEIDDGYFDIACERIRKAYAQPDMFVEAPREQAPTQEALDL